MPTRPFTRRQHFQNAAFLAALRRTGNARLAAATLGVHRATYTKRRARNAAFAAEWDMALAAAHAAFHLAGGTRPPEILPGTGRGPMRSPGEGPEAKRREKTLEAHHAALRTRGGEPTIVRTASGRLQLRLAPPGRMSAAAQQAFLRALSATANVRLSAAAAGFAHSSFYARRRASKAFAREMRRALEMGYDRLEWALLESADDPADGLWRHNDPPPIPPMSVAQALQLLYLHEKSVRRPWTEVLRRKRPGEPEETYIERLRALYRAENARTADDARARRRAERFERSGDWYLEDEAPPLDLPPLELVTGWSKADPKKRPHDPKRALFGGWRLKDWKKRQGQR